MLLCCRQKCVHTLTLFKRNAKRLFQRTNRTECFSNQHIKGAKWLSGGVLNSRPRSCGFEPNQPYCAVSLSKAQILTKYWFNPGSPFPCLKSDVKLFYFVFNKNYITISQNDQNMVSISIQNLLYSFFCR